VSGWDNTWGLQPGDEINWTVTAYYGRPTLLFGAPPSEGEGIQFAGRSSVGTSAAMASAATARLRRSVSRPR
ncbi:MAG TPA: hypothetical protein VJ867_15165, partial [Gemmatimonadaceae bacterium]|nr:hypothetical protein [Gemmatimonadaceae bacterium]